MLSPIKIILISSSLLSPAKYDKPIFLENDYSLEAAEYMMTKYPLSQDINSVLFRSIIEDNQR